MTDAKLYGRLRHTLVSTKYKKYAHLDGYSAYATDTFAFISHCVKHFVDKQGRPRYTYPQLLNMFHRNIIRVRVSV